MKSLLLIFAAFPLFLQAQDSNLRSTMLDPVEIYSTSVGRSIVTIALKENHLGEFEKDPVGYMVRNVNSDEILEKLQDGGNQGFIVTFITRKGKLFGDYNTQGQLKSYSMNFKNIALPKEIAWQLYDQYKGWHMIENAKIVKNGNTPRFREFYKVVMQNGKSKKTVKIDRSTSDPGKLVFNN